MATLIIDGDETFESGDILRIKNSTDDEWMLVTNATSAPTYTVTRDLDEQYTSNENPIWTKGTSVTNFGQSGDGVIYLTASETNAPYLSVVTHAGAPYDALTTRVRVGNLNGFLGESSDVYGFAAGETDAYMKYDPTNGLRIKGIVSIEAGSTIEGLDATSVVGWAHASDTTKIDGGDIYTGTVTADKITAGTYVGGDFVIASGGAFRSDNYVANTAGFKLDHESLELNDGTTVAGEGILETIMIYSMLFGGK